MPRAEADDRVGKRTDQPRRLSEREQQRQEELLDEALEETFPASDAIAPARIRPGRN
jgi:hypothetical protein